MIGKSVTSLGSGCPPMRFTVMIGTAKSFARYSTTGATGVRMAVITALASGKRIHCNAGTGLSLLDDRDGGHQVSAGRLVRVVPEPVGGRRRVVDGEHHRELHAVVVGVVQAGVLDAAGSSQRAGAARGQRAGHGQA